MLQKKKARKERKIGRKKNNLINKLSKLQYVKLLHCNDVVITYLQSCDNVVITLKLRHEIHKIMTFQRLCNNVLEIYHDVVMTLVRRHT